MPAVPSGPWMSGSAAFTSSRMARRFRTAGRNPLTRNGLTSLVTTRLRSRSLVTGWHLWERSPREFPSIFSIVVLRAPAQSAARAGAECRAGSRAIHRAQLDTSKNLAAEGLS
jgi:hypothetical protein